MRAHHEDEPERILALNTLGAPERRFLRGRRGETVDQASPEPVPTSRATIVRPEHIEPGEAAEWLGALRRDEDAAADEVDDGLEYLNRALHAHRVAFNDAYTREASTTSALVTRIGFGPGEEVAEGRFAEAWELPRSAAARAKRSMEGPEERFAALLGGREQVLVCEDLVLRTRVDFDAGRLRAAALQARIALEALLAEIGTNIPGNRGPALEADRDPAANAANAALRGDLDADTAEQLGECLRRMESALRARRLAGV